MHFKSSLVPHPQLKYKIDLSEQCMLQHKTLYASVCCYAITKFMQSKNFKCIYHNKSLPNLFNIYAILLDYIKQ